MVSTGRPDLAEDRYQREDADRAKAREVEKLAAEGNVQALLDMDVSEDEGLTRFALTEVLIKQMATNPKAVERVSQIIMPNEQNNRRRYAFLAMGSCDSPLVRESLIRILNGSESYVDRKRAGRALGKHAKRGSVRAYEALIDALENGDRDTMLGAVEGMRRSGKTESLPYLERALDEAEYGWDKDGIRTAIAAIRKEGTPQDRVDHLAISLNSENVYSLEDAEELGDLASRGDDKALRVLAEAFENGKTEAIRNQAGRGLVRCGGEKAIAVMRQVRDRIARHDNSYLARIQNVNWIIEECMDEAEAEVEEPEVIYEAPAEDVEEPKAAVREEAPVQEAGPARAGQLSSYDQMASDLYDTSESVRTRAAESLGKSRDADASDVTYLLIGVLYDESENVKMAAVKSLGEVGTVDAISPLMQMLADDSVSPEVVGSAIGKIISNTDSSDTSVNEAIEQGSEELRRNGGKPGKAAKKILGKLMERVKSEEARSAACKMSAEDEKALVQGVREAASYNRRGVYQGGSKKGGKRRRARR